MKELAVVAMVSLVTIGVADYSDLGYGTKFGTEPGQAVPGRTLGLGSSPSAIWGEEGILLEVLHRLELYKKLTGQEATPGYLETSCDSSCPEGTHCSYGICFCDSDTEQSYTSSVLEIGSTSNTSSVNSSSILTIDDYDYEDQKCKIEPDIDYAGSDIPSQSNLLVDNQQHCANLCLEHQQCLFWFYWSGAFGSTENKCWLKKSDKGRRPFAYGGKNQDGGVSGQKACGIAVPPTKCPISTASQHNESVPCIGFPRECWEWDKNAHCGANMTCECKPGTVYSERLETMCAPICDLVTIGECNIDLAVDCSSISPDTPPSPELTAFVEEILAGNASLSSSWSGSYDSLLAYIDHPDTLDTSLYLEAFCRDVDIFAEQLKESPSTAGDTVDEMVEAAAKILALVVTILLLCLVLLCLVGCICYCCLDSCRVKIKNLFAPTNYSEGLVNKAVADLDKDVENGNEKDQLEKVITGYQPVPQHPPSSYPQGVNSLPRTANTKTASLQKGASLPRNTSSLKRGVSPIPRAYPALAEAPPGYPESPQKTGVPPIGFPQSPPEYPQTPTPPGFPANPNKQAAVLYPTVPEK